MTRGLANMGRFIIYAWLLTYLYNQLVVTTETCVHLSVKVLAFKPMMCFISKHLSLTTLTDIVYNIYSWHSLFLYVQCVVLLANTLTRNITKVFIVAHSRCWRLRKTATTTVREHLAKMYSLSLNDNASFLSQAASVGVNKCVLRPC